MAVYKSKYTEEALIKRWDNFTSGARFAGGNEMTDWVFNASRKDNRVKLSKKPKIAFDPLGSFFVGKILPDGKGSKIVGMYKKSLTDYLVAAAISVIYFGIVSEYASRTGNPVLPLILIIGGIAALVLMFITYPGTKKKFGALIREVTESDSVVNYNGSFNEKAPTAEQVSKPSEPEKETPPEKPEEVKSKFKFKL